MLAGNCALFCFNNPFTGTVLGDVGGAAVAEDSHAFLTCASGHSHGHIGRVHMAVVWRVKRSDHAIEVVEGVFSRDKRGVNKLDIESEGATNGQRVAQPVHLVLGIGKAE